MIAPVLLLAALQETEAGPEIRARWRCEPAAVEVGEPFALVLELQHPREFSAASLFPGELALDESWVVLERRPPAQPERAAARAAEGATSSLVWSIASLEPGERGLAELLSALPFSSPVAHIEVGDARVSVRGLLSGDEDAPRPLREFPPGFAGGTGEPGRPRRALAGLAVLVLALLSGGALLFWSRRRRRRRATAPRALTPLERLAEIERLVAADAGTARELCFELTGLLRRTTDAARGVERDGLTDEEWLAEVRATPRIPRGACEDLTAVFERAAAVKYAGERPTSWALGETLGRARVALQAAVGAARAAMGGGPQGTGTTERADRAIRRSSP